jgi:hypothetical protein
VLILLRGGYSPAGRLGIGVGILEQEGTVAEIDQPKNDAEQKTIASNIEQRKLDIELEKLVIERTKVKWSAISVIVPLLAAIGTVGYGFRNTQKQAEMNFQLELVKSVIQERGPLEALNKAKFYANLFPERMATFKDVTWESFGTTGDPAFDAKLSSSPLSSLPSRL